MIRIIKSKVRETHIFIPYEPDKRIKLCGLLVRIVIDCCYMHRLPRPLHHLPRITPRLPRICNQIPRMLHCILVRPDDRQPFRHSLLSFRIYRSIKTIRQLQLLFTRMISQQQRECHIWILLLQPDHRFGSHPVESTVLPHQKLRNPILHNVFLYRSKDGWIEL